MAAGSRSTAGSPTRAGSQRHKRMSKKARAAVGARMKAYWAKRRQSRENQQLDQALHGPVTATQPLAQQELVNTLRLQKDFLEQQVNDRENIEVAIERLQKHSDQVLEIARRLVQVGSDLQAALKAHLLG